MKTSSTSVRVDSVSRSIMKVAFSLFFMLVTILAVFSYTISAGAQDGPAFSEVKLTDAHVQGYLKVAKKLPKLFEALDKAEGEPDKKLQDQIKAVGREGGFKSLAEMEEVVATIGFVLSGMDEDGNFQEPTELMEAELKEIEADKELDSKEKKDMVASIKESIANTPKLKHPSNVDVVKKYVKQLAELVPNEEGQQN